MGEVEVVDRGAREIVVFLRGAIDDEMRDAMAAAVDEVDQLEAVSMLDRVVIDMQKVTSLGDAGLDFVRSLEARGRQHGFTVSMSMLSGPAHRAVDAGGWPVEEGMPPMRA